MKHKTAVYSNVHHIVIHVDTLITEKFVTKDYGDNHTEKTKAAMNEIMCVEGIVDCSFRKYEIGITKGEMFNWSSILPTVLNIINRRFYGVDMLPGNYRFFDFEKASDGIRGDFIDDIVYKETPREAEMRREYDDLLAYE